MNRTNRWGIIAVLTVGIVLSVVGQSALAKEKDVWSDLNKRIQLYRDKKEKPTFVIPFEKLGDRWKSWEKFNKKGKLGYYAKKKSTLIEVGLLPMGSDKIDVEVGLEYGNWLGGWSLEPGVQTYTNTSQFYNLALITMNTTTEYVVPPHGRAPTGDGSIIAFKTDGLILLWLNFMKLISEEDSTLYFGVIKNLGGLVHLQGKGKGKCILDKKETILK